MFEFYAEYEYWFAAIQLILAMLGMGATLSTSDFAEVFKEVRGVTAGMGLQLLAVPLIAFGFISFVDLSPGVAIGLALCAAIPGGAVSNIFTLLARGNIALSISLTGLATLACVVTTPIVLSLLVTQHLPSDFVMPSGRIALEIALCLLLPLMLGMVYLSSFPETAVRFSKWCIRGSVFFILLIAIGAIGLGRLDLQAFGAFNILVLSLFIVTMVGASWLLSRLLGVRPSDVSAINMEVAVRNANLGVLIAASLFPAAARTADPTGDNAFFAVLLYGGLQMLVGVVLIYLSRRHGKARAQPRWQDAF